MPQKDELNAGQRAFIREYQIDRNATQAAIRAGYSQKTARSQGQRLLTNADIKTALERIEQSHAARCEMTIEAITQMLLEDRELARDSNQPSAAVSAAMGLAKLHGHLVDRKEVGKPGAFVGMTPEQKRERAVNLAKQLGLERITIPRLHS